MRKLFELAAADEKRLFSTYCWRTRLSLAHKGLEFQSIPWHFTEKDAIAMSGQGKVPVLLDGDQVIHDSWTIARYLEATYPDRPSLFGGPGGLAVTQFVDSWIAGTVLAQIARMIFVDVYNGIAEKDKAYFRAEREKRLGMTLEAFCADREERLPKFRQSLQPLRDTLKRQPFLGGENPNYADFVAFSAFQWPRVMSPLQIIEPDDPVQAWISRIVETYASVIAPVPVCA